MTRPEIMMTAPMLPSVDAALDAAFTVHRLWQAPDADSLLTAVGPRIRGLATSTLYGRVGDDLLSRLPALEIIASFGVGYDNVDAAAAAARGVVVTNTPHVLDEEVADLAIALILSTIRRLPQADRFVRDGRWEQGDFPLSPSLRGRRVGIVGLGNIGKAIARRLDGFDVAIAYHGRHRQDGVSYPYHATVQELAAESDVLIVVVPGSAGTRHLINATVLRALGSNGVLINIARGSVVDQDALIDALADGTILAAGLDVYENEPHVPAALIAMENVVLLPHIGSASIDTRAAMGQLVVDNLNRWFSTGTAITPVPESAGLPGAKH